MKHYLSLFIIFLSLFIVACSSSSHLIIGEVRPAISFTQVKIYTEKPSSFEKIAIIDASSRNSWAITEQGKMEAALELLKREAAKLGANGILLSSINDEHVIAPITNSYGTATYSFGAHKSLTATAIFVDGL